MKIKVTDPIKNIENESMTEAGQDITFRAVFHAVLNTSLSGDPPTGEFKARCFGLMQKLFTGNEVSITSDEAALLKERVGKATFLNTTIYGRVCELLDGPAEPASED